MSVYTYLYRLIQDGACQRILSKYDVQDVAIEHSVLNLATE